MSIQFSLIINHPKLETQNKRNKKNNSPSLKLRRAKKEQLSFAVPASASEEELKKPKELK